MRLLCTLTIALAFTQPLAHARGSDEVVDRIVASAGKKIVTLSDVHNELRMICFLNGGPSAIAQPSPERVRELAEKMVDRLLILQEMESGVFPVGPELEVAAVLLLVHKRLPGNAYQAELNRCGVSEREVIRYLDLQSRVEDFIDFRVRPGLQISQREVRSYYEDELTPASQQRNETVPPLESVRDKIVALLTEREKSKRLDAWMQELRGQTEIRIR